MRHFSADRAEDDDISVDGGRRSDGSAPSTPMKIFPIVSPMDPLIEALCEEGVTLASDGALLYNAKYSSPIVFVAGVDCHSRYAIYMHCETRDADGSMRCGLFAAYGIPMEAVLRMIVTNALQPLRC